MSFKMKKINQLKSDLSQIKISLHKYHGIIEADGETSKQEKVKLNELLSLLKKAEGKLATLTKAEETKLLNIGKQEIVDTASLEERSKTIQNIIPDFVPVFQEIIEGCSLTVMNYGSVSIDNQHILDGGTQFFAIHNDRVENIKVPKNCTGTISIKSTWVYKQDPKGLTWHSFGKDVQTASRVYSIDYTFKVDEEGNIQIFKGTVTKESEFLEDIADLIFYIRDLEVELEHKTTLSFTGGIIENQKSAFSEAITHYMSTLKIRKKDFVTSFSLVLELEKEVPIKMANNTKELVFEKENQAILSCDQLRTLQRWWEELNPKLKQNIRNKTAEIVIIGYTTETGTDLYNLKLGQDRAVDVRDLLVKIIGVNTENKSIAIISCSTKGEYSDQSKRYVKIIVKKR